MFPTHCWCRSVGKAHVALLAGLVACSLLLGFERSGWIVITQPIEISHSTNSLLGYSFIRDGGVLHIENHSAFLQVAFFSGADVTPDLYFRLSLIHISEPTRPY